MLSLTFFYFFSFVNWLTPFHFNLELIMWLAVATTQ